MFITHIQKLIRAPPNIFTFLLMNRFKKVAGAIRPVGMRIVRETGQGGNSGKNGISPSRHRSFREMIEWRKEREKKERLDRNKVSFLINYNNH